MPSAALLTLEKRGPAAMNLGQPARFEIVVRNVGSVRATQVRVEDTLPEGVRFLGGNPHPVLEDSRVVWNVPQVLPGEEHKLYLEVQATSAGELATQTSVSHTLESRVQVRPALVGLAVKAPPQARIGQATVFEVQLSNAGDRPVSQVVLTAQLPAGLIHQSGRAIESEPFYLPPHTSKTVTLTTTALQPGPQSMEVAILVQGRKDASAYTEVFVGEPSLVVQVPAAARIAPGRVSGLPIEVTNFGVRPARNLVVTSVLPKGLEFSGASDQGWHRGNSVQWAIDHLSPGQKRLLRVQVKATAAGDFVHVVTARAADNMKAQAEGHVLAEGAAQVSLDTKVKDNPLELNKETVFEIRVSNDGSLPDSNVQLRASLPEGMVPRFIDPLKYHLEGKQVVFDPIPRLEANAQVIVRIGVLATSAGDQRLRVQVASDQLRAPLSREERTLVYRD
jgi:uncharacterized repeat protein (TIGR01451 family)